MENKDRHVESNAIEMRFTGGTLVLRNDNQIEASGFFWPRELTVFMTAVHSYIDNDKETKRRDAKGTDTK